MCHRCNKKENLEETKLISSISDKYVGIELKNSYQWLGIPYAEHSSRAVCGGKLQEL